MASNEKRAVSRRDVLKASAATLLAGCADGGTSEVGGLTDETSDPSYASPDAGALLPKAGAGRTVAILGGGVAGLSAAQELAERGFTVTVYERKELGGKARSNTVPGTGSSGRPDLPGEHGYRGFLGYYHNLHELLERIPVPEGGKGVRGRLVPTTTAVFSRAGRADMTLPGFGESLGTAYWSQVTVSALFETVLGLVQSFTTLEFGEASYFVNRLLAFMTSCDERRYGQWEYLTWNDFLRTRFKSQEYNRLFAHGLTRNLAAMRAEDASANSIGIIGEATIFGVLGGGLDEGAASVDVLEGATNEMWIHPWVDHLASLGVSFQVGATVEALRCNAGGRITSAAVRDAYGTTREVTADWFILSMPAERAAPLMNADLVAHDPRLGRLGLLRTDWMNGLQFYLRAPTPITHGGLSYVDSPWALTSISQAQFWKRDMTSYGDGSVREIVSTAIADSVTPGVLYGKAARDCTRAEIAAEVWAQMKLHLNDGPTPVLTDAMLHSWWLDPAITGTGTAGAANDEPLLIQTPGSWANRPEAATGVENLFLAADYVRTDINVTTMEGANIAARKAVNALLAASGSLEPRVPIVKLWSPPALALTKEEDRLRYRFGLRNRWDVG